MIDKLILLDQDYALRHNKIMNQVKEHDRQIYAQITGVANSAISSWITGQQTFARAAGQAMQQWATMAIEKILQVGEQWIFEHVLMALINAIFGDQTATAASKQLAQQITTNVAIATSDAAVAAGNFKLGFRKQPS